MNQKNNKFKGKDIFLIIIIIINVVLIGSYIYCTSPVSSSKKDVTFIVKDGDSLVEIGNNLEDMGLVRNGKFFPVYAILKNSKDIYAAKYELNTSMSLGDIVSELKDGGKNVDEITITFKEGLNMRQIAKVISKNTNNSYDDVIATCSDETYINSLINKYWFITKDIKNKNIYYSLEGYLFPDSYNFSSKNVSTIEIFNKMIDHMDKKLSPYKKSLKKSSYSIHQILTMASIVELEGVDRNSRKDVAGVFYNRLNKKMNLGSDVTSYYGVKKSMTSDLSQYELDQVNPYNTRATSMKGKLPVGPICNASLVSIESAINPSSHDYYYFVADKNGKVYLTKDYEAHNKVIAELKAEGLWFEW